jgi:hypothetical protein
VPISGRRSQWSCHVVHKIGLYAPTHRHKAPGHVETLAGLEVGHLP